MPKRETEILQIDDLRLDLAARRVIRNDKEIELGRLTFDLFAVLARAAPAALSTDDIVAQVWKAESVSDETVQQRVSLLRRALGRDSDREYVQTVRGFGYRLATEARRLEEWKPSPAKMSAEPAAPRAAESRRTGRWVRIVLAALSILILLLILALLAMATRQIKRWSPQSFLLELAPPSGVGPSRAADLDISPSGQVAAPRASTPGTSSQVPARSQTSPVTVSSTVP